MSKLLLFTFLTLNLPPLKAASLQVKGEDHLRNIKQLTNGGENAEAYWSFDSKQLIFQSTRGDLGCDQIFTIDPDGKDAARMVSTGKGRTTCAYFLKGNKDIVYSSTHEKGPACPPVPDRSEGYVWALDDFAIYRAKADGSQVRRLTNRKTGYDAEATVCARDGAIIFTSDRDGDLELYRMDADGSNVIRLTHTPGYDGGAFFSQDCSQIVWRASRPTGKALKDYQRLLRQKKVRPGKLEIYVASADGGNVRQITWLDAASFAPYFHPNGKRVLFSTNYGDPKGREFNIWAVNTDGTALEQITYAPGFDGFPMFSWDGKRLAFASNRNQGKRGETNVFVADWVDSPPRFKPDLTDRLMENVRWLAADEREGRGIGTKGLEDAATYLSKAFARVGLSGGMPGGKFRQPLDVVTGLEGTATLTIDGKAVPAKDAKGKANLVPLPFSATSSFTGTSVAAGHGIVAKKPPVNDYKGLDVKGKVVVVRRFTPRGGAFKDKRLGMRLGDMNFKTFQAGKQGAAALIIVDTPAPGTDEAPLPRLATNGYSSAAGIPVIAVRREHGAALLKGSHQISLKTKVIRKRKPSPNIVGVLRSKHPQKKKGAIVIGAHFDHLGYGGSGSLEVGKRVIHNGADDNASGTAALITIAEILGKRQEELLRDVWFVAFTGEESGLIGSKFFVDNRPPELKGDGIVAMLNMDMIGRMRENKLNILGGESAKEWRELLTGQCRAERVNCTIGGSGYGPSDQMSFYTAGIPVLHFFTGAHHDYHKASDDTDKVNGGGAVQVARILAGTTLALGQKATPLTYQRTVASHPYKGDSRATGASMGTIPTYGEDSPTLPGMLLSDVRPGGPADKAGLKGGDRILRIGATRIHNVRDLMYVLQESEPGSKARVHYKRGAKVHKTTVTFGKPRRYVAN